MNEVVVGSNSKCGHASNFEIVGMGSCKLRAFEMRAEGNDRRVSGFHVEYALSVCFAGRNSEMKTKLIEVKAQRDQVLS